VYTLAPCTVASSVLLRQDLANWQKLNVTAFVVSGIVATVDGITGEPYEDADGTRAVDTALRGARLHD
jgi:hypothetical protein